MSSNLCGRGYGYPLKATHLFAAHQVIQMIMALAQAYPFVGTWWGLYFIDGSMTFPLDRVFVYYIYTFPLDSLPVQVLHRCLHMWFANWHEHTAMQAVSCTSSCSFFVLSDGTLWRSPSCNSSSCTGVLRLDNKNISKLDSGVFANMPNVASMWDFTMMMRSQSYLFLSTLFVPSIYDFLFI